jgi:hypothetical protein
MRARIYLEDNFFNTFKNYEASQNIFENDTKTENKNRLVDILNNSEIHLPISDREAIKIHKKLSQNYVPSDAREYYIFRAIRNNRLKLNPIDQNKPFSLFFLDKIDDDIINFNTCNNLISLGINYNFTNPIIPKSFASREVNKEMVGINSINHRCRNALIIDPYLFEDQSRMEPKIPNVIKLLKELYFDNTNSDCHLSLLINNPGNNGKIESKIKAIKEGINNPKLKISVYAHKEGLLKNNRFLITDYSIIDSQHLFDRDASISFASLYDGEINKNFIRVNNLLEIIKEDFNTTPIHIGTIKYKFDNILDNGLFEELEI